MTAQRLTTIAVDSLAALSVPAAWSPRWVQHRLVEAYSIERRLPRAKRTTMSTWPAVHYEFSDVVGWNDARERVLEAWAATPGAVVPVELTRMEQAHEWLRVILVRHEVERTCLASWAAAIAYRHSLRSLLQRRRWARTTFYRHVSTGSFIIACKLRADDVPVS